MSRTKIITWNKKDNRHYPYMFMVEKKLAERNEVIGLYDYDLPLWKTISIVKDADYFVGTDGFLLHLCDYLGLSGIAIWNKENFVKNFPHKNVVAVSSMASPIYIIGLFNKLYGDKK